LCRLREGRSLEPALAFEIIQEETAEHRQLTVKHACQSLGVSRSGYYAWCGRPPSARALEDAHLAPLIKHAWEQSEGTYGARRIRYDLLDLGEQHGVEKIARIMRNNSLSGRVVRLKRRMRQLESEGLHAVDLVRRNFDPDGPNQLWVADITQINTWEGPLYIAAVMDAYSRRIIGWSMEPHMRADIVVDAITMALHRRRPAAGVIHHSDHGSQYTSYTFGKKLRDAGLLPSMGRVRTAADNAVAESFFATLKKEKTNRRSWPTRDELRSTVFEFIEGRYNTRRRHSRLGYVSPAQFELSRVS
jgi:putative transposase